MSKKIQRPLLRGTLVDVGRWGDYPGKPDMQKRYASLAVHCPYCDHLHYHGWDPADSGRVVRHRVPHCSNEKSPFLKGGYFISTIRKSEPGYTSHVVTPGVELVRKKLILD